jgi:hypothetical protein
VLCISFRALNFILIPLSLIIVQGRSPLNKKVKDSQVSAFEILASIAGKLLEESESSASSNASEGNNQHSFREGIIVQDRQDEAKPSITEGIHHGSSGESIFTTEVASQNLDQKPLVHTEPDFSLESKLLNQILKIGFILVD